MTSLQKLQLEQSELRSKIGSVLEKDVSDRTDGDRSELAAHTKRAGELEIEIRAAITAESLEPEAKEETRSTESPEDKEYREMVRGADVGAIFAAAVTQGRTEGQTAELQKHLGLRSNMVPLELIEDPVEERAAATITGDVGAAQRPIIQPIFSRGDAAFLNVSMPRVSVGDSVYPILTSRPTVSARLTDSTAATETTGTFVTETLAPGRIQAAFRYRRTDAARFAGMGNALRQALNAGLSESLDAKVVAQIISDSTRVDASAAFTFALYRSGLVYDRIDGRFATGESDLRVLIGAPTLKDMAPLYRTNNSELSVIELVRRITGGVRVSPHVAAVASHKQDAIVRLGSRMDAVAPLWQGVSLITDEITAADKGEIVITAILLGAYKVLRTGGFAQVQTQHQ